MKWKAVKLDANTLKSAKGVRFMYFTRYMSLSGYEAHRAPNHPDMWLLSRGDRFDERKGRNVTDVQLLKLFNRVGGFPSISEHKDGHALVTRDPYWKPQKKRPKRAPQKQIKVDRNHEVVRSLVDRFLKKKA